MVESSAMNGVDAAVFKFEYKLNDEIKSELETQLNSALAADDSLKSKILPNAVLERMVSESLNDSNFEDDEELNDDDLNDSMLLDELEHIAEEGQAGARAANVAEAAAVDLSGTTLATVKAISERLTMYNEASAKATEVDDEAKFRRFERAIKTLDDLLEQAKSGQAVNLNDMPPEVSLSKITGSAISTATAGNTDAADEEIAKKQELMRQQKTYKQKAFETKRAGDAAAALMYFHVAKQLDLALNLYAANTEIQFQDMPPSPEDLQRFLAEHNIETVD